ncbi:hypothetical protein Aau02nite_52460 [Amorphoplanes auranticolor]|uniref:Uncharacterized protein n=1 Tax=Actinoplanes auranticolor TaxID=47988 RepID=A0A919VXF2_9ACTN|nr:hypothetical protein Aau02nite_52460 [Actinoplanes auranticolor]
MVGQIAGDQAAGPHQQLAVRAPDAFLAGGQALEHPRHPFGLLGTGEPVGNQDDDALALAICGHRATPTLAAPHFDDRLARPGHYRLARPRLGFTLRR